MGTSASLTCQSDGRGPDGNFEAARPMRCTRTGVGQRTVHFSALSLLFLISEPRDMWADDSEQTHLFGVRRVLPAVQPWRLFGASGVLFFLPNNNSVQPTPRLRRALRHCMRLFLDITGIMKSLDTALRN